MTSFFKYFQRSFFLALSVVFIFDISCKAQDSTKAAASRKIESAEIQFVNQWPPATGQQQKKGFWKSIGNIFLGKKNPVLSRPVSLVVDKQHAYWILDQQNKAVFQVSKEAGKIPSFISKENFNLSSLVGICNFLPNEILFTDSYLNKIFLLNTEKKICTVFNDSLKLDKPTGIAYSPVSHQIWVVETGNHRLVVLNEHGEVVKKIGSRGKAKGDFNFPTHICIDKIGNVYVVDAMNFRVQVFNKDGVVLSVFGSNGDATGYFASPKGIATDSYGHIYIADALFHVVQIFDIDGNYLYTFGSQGQGEGQFWMPSGVFIDESDKVYIADSYNSRIQVFQFIAGGRK